MVIIVIVNLYRFITQPIKLSFWVDSSSVIHFKYFPYRNNILDTVGILSLNHRVFIPKNRMAVNPRLFGKYPF